MFSSSEVGDAWIGLQSFVLTTYHFIYAFVDFLLDMVLRNERKLDTIDEEVSDSGQGSKRQRLRKLRHKFSKRHLSPSRPVWPSP